jgi:hypothetical protein
MKKKDDKIELDPVSQIEIEKLHQRQAIRTEAFLQSKKHTATVIHLEGEEVLTEALLFKHPVSLLEKYLLLSSLCLWCLILLWAVLEFLNHTPQNLGVYLSFLGLAVRPFLAFVLFTVVLTCTGFRLAVKEIYIQLGHGIVLADPKGKRFAQIENRIYDLRIANKILSWLTCVALATLGFSLLGWEVAITSLGGTRGAIIFYIVFGFVLYFATSRLFELKED